MLFSRTPSLGRVLPSFRRCFYDSAPLDTRHRVKRGVRVTGLPPAFSLDEIFAHTRHEGASEIGPPIHIDAPKYKSTALTIHFVDQQAALDFLASANKEPVTVQGNAVQFHHQWALALPYQTVLSLAEGITRTLVVYNVLEKKVDEAKLKKMFGKYGLVENVAIDHESSTATVSFLGIAEAAVALENAFKDFGLKMGLAEDRLSSFERLDEEQAMTLLIHNLPRRTSLAQVLHVMADVGTVTKLVMSDNKSTASVYFSSPEPVKTVLQNTVRFRGAHHIYKDALFSPGKKSRPLTPGLTMALRAGMTHRIFVGLIKNSDIKNNSWPWFTADALAGRRLPGLFNLRAFQGPGGLDEKTGYMFLSFASLATARSAGKFLLKNPMMQPYSLQFAKSKQTREAQSKRAKNNHEEETEKKDEPELPRVSI